MLCYSFQLKTSVCSVCACGSPFIVIVSWKISHAGNLSRLSAENMFSCRIKLIQMIWPLLLSEIQRQSVLPHALLVFQLMPNVDSILQCWANVNKVIKGTIKEPGVGKVKSTLLFVHFLHQPYEEMIIVMYTVAWCFSDHYWVGWFYRETTDLTELITISQPLIVIGVSIHTHLFWCLK